MIDIHSHLLPGIDDGAETLEDSVATARWLAGQGVTDIIVTPHYVSETNFASSRQQNLGLLKKLKLELKKAEVKVNLYIGNEIYIDRDITNLIKKGVVSTLNNSEYLLVELPLDEEYPNYEDILLDLIQKGYRVILAHPERYTILQDDYSRVEDLYKMGVLFQCNLGSIYGKYGRKAKKMVKKLATEKKIFAFGSDTHRIRKDEVVVMAQKKLKKYYNERELNQVLVRNAKKILR